MLSTDQITKYFVGLDQWKAAVAERDARIAELERQLEEARKDAERYRWLREDSIFCNLATPHPWPVWGTSHEDAFPIWKSDLDASIDAARAAIKEQT